MKRYGSVYVPPLSSGVGLQQSLTILYVTPWRSLISSVVVGVHEE